MSSPTGGHEQCQGQTPTPSEILRTLYQWGITANKWKTYFDILDKALQIFNSMSPVEATAIISAILLPLGGWFFCRDISSAPECACPFAGLRSIEVYDCTVEEGLFAVLCLAARCGGVIALVVGGLCICICTDLGLFAVGVESTGSGWVADNDELVCWSTTTWHLRVMRLWQLSLSGDNLSEQEQTSKIEVYIDLVLL